MDLTNNAPASWSAAASVSATPLSPAGQLSRADMPSTAVSSRRGSRPASLPPHSTTLPRLLLTAFVLLHSSFVIAAEPPEPPRQELWLPSDKLDSFLQKNPKAVLLSPAEYEVLIRDAGKTEPPRDPKLEPPKKLIIESLHLTGTAEPGATTLQLSGTLTVHVPADGWAQESLAWPYYFQISQMQTLTGGPLLAWLSNEEFKADKVPAETMRRLNLAVRGAGKRELRFTGTLPLYYRLFSGERGLDLQHIGCAGRVTLTLPEGAELLPGSAAQQSGRTVTAAFDHRFIRRTDNGDPLTSVPLEKRTAGATLPDAVRLRWTDPQRDAGVSPLRFVENSGRVTLEVSDARLRTRLEFTVHARAGQNGRHESDWPILGGEGTQVTSVKGDDVLAWRQDAGVLHVTLAQSTAAAPVEVMLERPLTLTAAATHALPLLRLPLTLTAELRTAEGVDLLALDGLRDSRVQLDAAAAPQITLRPAQARLEADVDTAAKLDRDSLRIDRTLNLRSDRPVSSVTLVLPEGEEFIAIMEPKAPGVDPVLGNASINNAVSNSNVAVANVGRQEITQVGVLNSAVVTPNVINQPIFNERAVVTQGAQVAPPESSRLIISNGTGQSVVSVRAQPFTWRRAGNTITLLFNQLISPNYSPKLFVVSRQKLAKAWSGPKNPETLTLAHLGIPEAVKVAGYTALDFDDSWRVALKSANGLEDRDARLTPVKGRMAWFGLREHALTFEVERAEAVFSAEVTAYALPRARSVEIEGQFTLTISGAPLRRFQVQLPKESAKLLRVTSPLIGEQQLDEATGLWTLTLRQEAKGRQNIRWRMSLSSVSELRVDESVNTPKPPNAPNTPLTDSSLSDSQLLSAALPSIRFPTARRFSGTWVIEANTDTQLSTQTQGMQPLDVLKAPVVEAYAPRHRITSAFSFGVAEHALTLTARRHAHSELAPLVITHLRLTSVLDAHGPALHEARLTLLHTGEQFIPLTLPPGAALLSTLANGEAVKPVRTSGEAVAVPLPAASANVPTTITLQYRLQHNAWTAKGELDVPPVRFASGVPVLETEWLLHTPKTFSITDPDTTLESLDVKEVPNVVVAALQSLGVIRKPDIMADSSGSRVAGLANREIMRRYARLDDAKAAIARGDSLFIEGDYEGSLSSYQAAVSAIPNAPEAAEWLAYASLKYADCAVVVAKERAKQGKVDDARQALNDALVLQPEHKNARKLLDNLSNPNVDLPVSAQQTAQIARGLHLAASTVELGNYDQGIAHYQDVLRIDPYSTAARRGIENAERRRQQYFRAAYDHQRSKMLAQVDEMWEDKVPTNVTALAATPIPLARGRSAGAYLTEKMDRIILPEIKFQNTPVAQAVEFLRVKSRELDTFEVDASRKGVNIIVRSADIPADARVSLDLKNVPLSEALRYVCDLSQTKLKVDAYAVVITPIMDNNTEMLSRTFKVQSGNLNGVDIKELLKKQGVAFPDGAYAAYDAKTNQILVRNTQAELDLAEAVLEPRQRDGREQGAGRRAAAAPVAGMLENAEADSFATPAIPAATPPPPSKADPFGDAPSPRFGWVDTNEPVISRGRSGLLPLTVQMPSEGRVLRFAGLQPPPVLHLRYQSWEHQMRWAVLAMLGGMVAFALLAWRRRPWMKTTLIVVLASLAFPLLLEGQSLALANAAAFGWVVMFVVRVLASLIQRLPQAESTLDGEGVAA